MLIYKAVVKWCKANETLFQTTLRATEGKALQQVAVRKELHLVLWCLDFGLMQARLFLPLAPAGIAPDFFFSPYPTLPDLQCDLYSFSTNLIHILTNINPGTFPSANPTNRACWICLLKTPPKLPSSCVVLCWGHYRGARHWFKQLCMALTSEVWHTHKSTIQDLKKGTLLTHTAQQMWSL